MNADAEKAALDASIHEMAAALDTYPTRPTATSLGIEKFGWITMESECIKEELYLFFRRTTEMIRNQSNIAM